MNAVFGTPASGNHAVAACRVAMAVKSTVELQSEGNVRVRAGLDSGEVIVRYRRHGATERIEVTGVVGSTPERAASAARRRSVARGMSRKPEDMFGFSAGAGRGPAEHRMVP